MSLLVKVCVILALPGIASSSTAKKQTEIEQQEADVLEVTVESSYADLKENVAKALGTVKAGIVESLEDESCLLQTKQEVQKKRRHPEAQKKWADKDAEERAAEAIYRGKSTRTKTVGDEAHVNLTLVEFIGDSQAMESGLDQNVQSQLHKAGFATHLSTIGGQKLVHSPKSALSRLPYLCDRGKPDVFILWMGLNDVKIGSIEYKKDVKSADYKTELDTVLAAISSTCGSPKVVLVRPPLYTHVLVAHDPVGTAAWPNSHIPNMVHVVAQVYATIKQNRSLRIVDAQALSDTNDFDRIGHFCTDKRQCKTTDEISKAIVQAVESLVAEEKPVTPGLHFLNATRVANTSTWLKVLAGTSMPVAALEGIVYAFRNAPLVESVTHGRPWLPLFDVARLLGALHIVAFHLFQNSFEWCGFGKYWLSFFFFVSGFSCSYTAGPQMQGPMATAKRGLSKICLAHAVGVVIFLLAQWDDVFTAPWYDVLTTVTLTQSVLPPFHSTLNGPAWFLSSLMVLWFLAPHWHSFLGRITQVQRLLLLAFCWLATLAPSLVCNVALNLNLNVGGDVPQLVEFHFSQRWQVFLGGMAFEYAARGQKISHLLKISSMVCLFAGLAGISQMSPPGFQMNSHYLLFDHGFATFPFFCAFAALALSFPTKSKNPPTKWAGLLALPIFILHVPVMALVELVGGGSIAFCFVLVLCSVGLVFVEQLRGTQAPRGKRAMAVPGK